jgi:orotidine-5'-phosphate decarboxylase
MIQRPASGAARIIPALDSGDAARAQALAESLAPHCGLLKVGLELFTSAGPHIVSALARHRPIFLDLKLHDIPNTVAGAVRSLLALKPGTRVTVGFSDPSARSAQGFVMRCEPKGSRFRIAIKFDAASI